MRLLIFLFFVEVLFAANWTTTDLQSGDEHLSFLLHKHNATADGNTLLVIGGVHGDEPGAYFAASLLTTHYNIIKGSVWVVPNLNFESLIRNKRGIYGDMNRKFAYVAKNDSDYRSVMRIKEIVLEPQVDLVINLHDGHGFYRDRWQNQIFNPRAWGQSFVIDQKRLDDVKFGNMDEIAQKVKERLNKHLSLDHHFFSVKNTETRYKDEEMQRSLTYFAVTNLVPAFGQETSKNIDALALKVEYHLRSIEEFMKIMDIEFERSFEMNFEGIQAALNEYGNVRINDNIVLSLTDLRSYVNYLPLKSSGNRFSFEHPLAAIKKRGNVYDLFVGNKHIAALTPQYFDLHCEIDGVMLVVDGKEVKAKMGDEVDVEKDFLVKAQSDIRVNAIGYTKNGVESEDEILLNKKMFVSKFSLDVRGSTYRVEFYKDNSFCGMINVVFK